MKYPYLVEEFKDKLSRQHNGLIKENNTYEILNNVFSGIFIIKRHVRYRDYYIDFVLYSDKVDIAIECDEYGHSNYDKRKEANREKEIKENFNLVRFNPDSESSITETINEILKLTHK